MAAYCLLWNWPPDLDGEIRSGFARAAFDIDSLQAALHGSWGVGALDRMISSLSRELTVLSGLPSFWCVADDNIRHPGFLTAALKRC